MEKWILFAVSLAPWIVCGILLILYGIEMKKVGEDIKNIKSKLTTK